MNRNRLGLAVVLALLASLSQPSLAVANTWQVPGGQVVAGSPRAVAAGGPEGHVFIASSAQVVEATADGQVVRSLPTIPSPVTAMAVDAAGAIYTTRQTGGPAIETEIRKTTPDGATAWTLTSQMVQPGGLAVTGGRLWWRNAGFVDSVTTTDGTDPRQIQIVARDLAATPDGDLLITTADGAIQYTSTGVEVRRIPQFRGAIATSPDGHVYGDEGWWGSNSGIRLMKLDIGGGWSTGQVGSNHLMDVAAAAGDVVWTIQSDRASFFLMRLDASTPDATLTATESLTDTSRTITLDASGSSVPFGQVRSFEWDLDGDGTFETSTGVEPRILHRYATRGTRSPAVRVTSERGGTAVAQVNLDVRQGSAAGPVGASINQGARYTNDPEVTVHLRWPTFAQNFLISNDGGFVPAAQGPVVPTYSWRLDGSGPERLPKTIYVRFSGGTAGPETYQDDIILDQTKPTIVTGTATPASATSNRAGGTTRRVYRVRVTATDKTSGVRRMQITQRKARPGDWLRYKKARSYASHQSKVFVRVQDRAGNVSRWKRIA